MYVHVNERNTYTSIQLFQLFANLISYAYKMYEISTTWKKEAKLK